MGFSDFMIKVRDWDIRSAKWFSRHFYILFFEIFLLAVFFVFFANAIQVIAVGGEIHPDNISEKLQFAQTVNGLLLVLLVILNSFWIVHLFNTVIRYRAILKDISFNISKINRK